MEDSNSKVPWPSSLCASTVAKAQASRRELRTFEQALYMVERRPDENGRSVLLCYRGEELKELLPPETSVRSRVHEYGGGSYLVGDLGTFYVEEYDQQIYRLDGQGSVSKLTDQASSRFADLCEHRQSNRLICVRENHQGKEVSNDLVSIDIASGEIASIASGYDFYAAPSIDSHGRCLAFICWDHPNMPWHNNHLVRVSLSKDGFPQGSEELLGDQHSSKSQPCWGLDGSLYFLDDRSGWWNIWRQPVGEAAPEHFLPIEADLGRAQWELGSRSYVVNDDLSIVAVASKSGLDRVVICDSDSHHWRTLASDQTVFSGLCGSGSFNACLASGPTSATGVWKLSDKEVSCILSPAELPVSLDTVSVGESIEFLTRDNRIAQGFFYPPNPQSSFQAIGLPPLIMVMHGGPTTACGNGFNPLFQYWTSRGVAVFDLNYRGSTGFGREYRMALEGQWGVADVEDCESAAKFLIEKGLVDADRLAIRGGSAGGFTALAVAAGSDVFAVVGCHYGIGDLMLLAQETHKFESRYLDHLIGVLPECEARYHNRSPIHQLHNIRCPVFISHGQMDQVVPITQALTMASALQAQNLEVETLLFENERHGYTKEDNISMLLEKELAFYAQVFQRSGSH